MISNQSVTVFGAYGHTGRFVVAELQRRGMTPILAGRDAEKLNAMRDMYPEVDSRVASIDDAASLDHALSGAVAVINCSGPFLDTAPPVIEAALRARIHYLDLTAEQPVVIAAFEHFADRAHEAGIIIVAAMAFYGGLSDLLATAAMGDWTAADDIHIAIALDSWMPTAGTRLTGKRNTARRLVFTNHQLEFLADPPPTSEWVFPPPFGTQDVVALPFSETILIASHLQTAEIHTYLNLTPLKDLRDPTTQPPEAVDEEGRSAQIFLMDVLVRQQGEERRATAQGQDIYAVTAPLVVEAVQRLLEGRFQGAGVVAPGKLFDARDFLESLSPEHLSFALG